jgi:hypothetical protein
MFGAQGVDKYAEFDDVRARDANPLNGDNDGATVGQPFGGNIPYSYSFDGNNDYVNNYSAALNSVFDGNSFTVGLFAQMANAGVWTDGQVRRLQIIRVDGNNEVDLDKWSVSNQLRLNYIAGGVAVAQTINTSTLNPFFIAFTADTVAGVGRLFFNGVQQGSDIVLSGTWAGNLDSTRTVIGANNTTPTNVTSGLIAEDFIHPTRAMTPAEIAEIYQWSGI